MPGEVKQSHQSALEMCNLSWTPHYSLETGLEIRVDRWPESTKNPVGPPNRVRQWSDGLPKLCQRTLHLLAFFITFAVAVTATMFFVFNISNIVIYSFFVASGNSISSNVYAE